MICPLKQFVSSLEIWIPLIAFTKLQYDYIYNHLHINKLLYKFQSGFLPGYSTTHQLIELYDNILLALDKKTNN